MTASTVALLMPSGVLALPDADVQGTELWLHKADLRTATGFELKAEGLCRDELCFPLPRGRESEFARDGRVNLAAFWRHRGGGVAATKDGDVWAFSEPLDEQLARIESLEAPDFTLPDRHGTMHALSDYRGRKVLLTAWASW